jgi:hypothetical protein
MGIRTDMKERIDALDALDVEGRFLLEAMRRLETDAVIDAVSVASAVKHDIDRIIAVGAAVIAERSTRDKGQSGAAAVRGHASPVSLVQSISGGTRADAARAVRIGEALLEGAGAAVEDSEITSYDSSESAVVTEVPWHDALGKAMLSGALTPAQHEAILRGLGEPPVDSFSVDADAVRDVWTLAAQQLIAEAAGVEVDEMVRRARQVRDALDPIGAEERHARRFERRSFRLWTDADGIRHSHMTFDDENGAFWETVISAALRPRRGGPRFVTDEERAAADELIADTRSNEQLAYDLVTSVFRAGALATASDVFGARQPGVRMVVVRDAVGPRDAFGRMLATGHLEDGGDAIAGSVIDRALCDVGSVEVTVDSCGNPLDVGREQRLFTAKHRLALAVRDGGCMWPGCRAQASYCEAHHIDNWSDGGRTDGERGILLCRFHHTLLHNAGWKITREKLGPFVLHRPPEMDGEPIVLRSKSAVRWAWDPPPPEVRAGWRAA